MRANRAEVIIVSLSLSLSIIVLSCSPRLENRVRAFEKACNSHDVDRIMAFYTEDIRFEAVGMFVKVGKQEVRKLTEWDATIHSTLVFADLKVSRDTVTIKRITEENDWFRLAGIEKADYESSLIIFRDGLIKEIRTKPTQGSMKLIADTFHSIVEWASKERSQELAELLPEGQFTYNGETARRWLALLREWREEAD